MATNSEIAYKALRNNLNQAISGKNVDAVLMAIADSAGDYLITNVQAVHDNLFIVSATGAYLEQRLGDFGITKPANVGLSDDVFRALGLQVKNRKQVRDLVQNILNIIFGDEYTKANISSANLEPYALKDGDQLLIQFDSGKIAQIVFRASQFENIAAATAQEVADAITINLRTLGFTGTALLQNNGNGNLVSIFSHTIGPASSIAILGGRSQNEFKFPQLRPTTGDATTQWTLSLGNEGNIRMTWTGGTDPSIGKVQVDDYANIFGSGFNPGNQGTFTIATVQGGTITNAYVEFPNTLGTFQTTAQGSPDGVLFYDPVKRNILSNTQYASAYQFSNGVLSLFLPATTRVIERSRIGSAHLPLSGPSLNSAFGPYVYDLSKKYTIGAANTVTTQQVSGSQIVVDVANSTQFPNSQGYLVFEWGTSREEGPVPYTAAPSGTSILINPAYKFKFTHATGSSVFIVSSNAPVVLDALGRDYQFYLTDVVSGRIYAETLIQEIIATGITLAITILYPNDIGLGKWSTPFSEKTTIWGP